MTTPRTRRSHLVAALTALTALAAALALPSAAQEPRRPPPEAYTACQSAPQGAACTSQTPHGTVAGTCSPDPGGQLFCRLPHPPPPPEALAACEGQAAGQACAVSMGGRSMDGTCAAVDDGRLACRPSGPPPGAPPR